MLLPGLLFVGLVWLVLISFILRSVYGVISMRVNPVERKAPKSRKRVDAIDCIFKTRLGTYGMYTYLANLVYVSNEVDRTSRL